MWTQRAKRRKPNFFEVRALDLGLCGFCRIGAFRGLQSGCRALGFGALMFWIVELCVVGICFRALRFEACGLQFGVFQGRCFSCWARAQVPNLGHRGLGLRRVDKPFKPLHPPPKPKPRPAPLKPLIPGTLNPKELMVSCTVSPHTHRHILARTHAHILLHTPNPTWRPRGLSK